MRTTIDIEDALLERAKRLALKEKQTLGGVVGAALAAYLASRKSAGKDPPFQLLARGRAGGRFPTHAEMLAVEEEEEGKALKIPRGRRRAAP
jgi:predicted transcriptional regulator